MKKVLGSVFDQPSSKASNATNKSATDVQRQNLSSHKSSGSHNRRERQPDTIVNIATPTLSDLPAIEHERAILVEASSSSFGSECLRLINIVFQTSQTFPSIMGTCGNISQYLRKELFKKYPDEYFHVILGQNNAFGFAIDDGDYFAEVEQEQYRVLIFTTRREQKVNLKIHDANSQMLLEWKSLTVKPTKK
ncbi:unnamed protein product [Adineta ricciae]|uniref:Uncharacterized protein n=1 Tax=Adineta ricciae TaxID=249248 RepID=A0A814WYW8_ADIRI|nr:unnamed protein product [Adineta ricciae]CAF1208412.1 unnamed protein product [Adineta ricciae]